MKKIALFIKPDQKSEKVKNDFCNIPEVTFFDASLYNDTPDAVVCFGGDGTILRAIAYSLEKNVPLLSVNTGSLGFLSTFGPEDKDDFQKTILNGIRDFEKIKLFSVKTTNYNSSFQTNKLLFLNEVVIHRKVSEYSANGAISIKVLINGKESQAFVADGVIISSPFGSTAYSFSAGGSILSPDLPALIITPICAHSNAYTLVIPDNNSIKVELGDKSRDCIVSVDGQNGILIKKNESITIELSKQKLKIIRGKSDFYSRLNTKILKWGSENV